MRLDHLLSKEHLAQSRSWSGEASRAISRTNDSRWLLKGGTSTSWPSARRRRQYIRFTGTERGVHREGGLARCWVLRERAIARNLRVGLRAGYRIRLAVEPPGTPGQAPMNEAETARSLRTAQWTRASYICGQVFKGTRWMPWHQEPMKDVGACDKPRGAGNRAVIRGSPNGETRLETCPVTHA